MNSFFLCLFHMGNARWTTCKLTWFDNNGFPFSIFNSKDAVSINLAKSRMRSFIFRTKSSRNCQSLLMITSVTTRKPRFKVNNSGAGVEWYYGYSSWNDKTLIQKLTVEELLSYGPRHSQMSDSNVTFYLISECLAYQSGKVVAIPWEGIVIDDKKWHMIFTTAAMPLRRHQDNKATGYNRTAVIQ